MSLVTRLLISLLSLPLALGVPTAATNEACKSISAAIKGVVSLPGEPKYIKENKDYYNVGLAELGPACIAFPQDAQDVSAIVGVLNQTPGVSFAVKGGGHDPNPGHSSVKDGVLIALRSMVGVELDKKLGLAYVKPGGHWWDVIPPLDQQGYTIVAGRLAVVGVGGYLAQGGLSFLSGQYGLAADNVIEWETVLPNGTIANIKANERPELARAMRGGGSQFGIITKFTCKAYPMGQAWGGVRLYTGNRDKVLAALHDFIPRMQQDPKASIIVTGGMGLPSIPSLTGVLPSLSGLLGGSAPKASSIPKVSSVPKASSNPISKNTRFLDALNSLPAAGLDMPKGVSSSGENSPLGDFMGLLAGSPLAAMLPHGTQGRSVLDPGTVFSSNTTAAAEAAAGPWEAFGVFMTYDGPKPPKGAFGLFEDIVPTYDLCKTQSYSDVIGLTNSLWTFGINTRASFRSITLPYRKDDPGYYGFIEDQWAKISTKYGLSAGSTIAFQPFPAVIGKQSEARGGNAMGLSGRDKDRIILEIAGLYSNAGDDEKMQQMGKEFTELLHADANAFMAKDKGVEQYHPYFMNDAGPDQDVFGSYKESALFAKLQKEIDPKGLFAKRAGGFRIKQNQ